MPMNSEAAMASREKLLRYWIAVATIGAVTIFAIIVSLAVIWFSATKERDAALYQQRHSYEVVVLARTLDGTLAQSEAALGRFVISGDKGKGRQFLDHWRRAGSLLSKIETQAASKTTQKLLNQLRRAYETRGEELNAVALRTNYDQNAQALSKFYTAGKSDALRQMGALLESVDQNERKLLDMRTARAEATIKRSNRLGQIVSVMGIILVAGLIFFVWTALQAWMRRLTEEVRNEELEEAVEHRTAELLDVNNRLLTEMTVREETEARLRQAHKMEAVGQLTGGIAHDFNNMLAVVIGGLEIAKRRLAKDPIAVETHLDNAMEGATRAAALTKRLLAFSRAEPLMASAADPNILLGDMSDLLDRTIGDMIAVRILPFAGTWPIFVDPHQFENAVLNLAVNARDAMPNGGTLTISIANGTLAKKDFEGAPAGDYVRIAVTDTGTGMNDEVRRRIFEPFFTTKPLGSGTGLGLSQVFNFARQSEGSVVVESTPGQGTTVAMFLPRSAELPRNERSVPARKGQPLAILPAHSILVVEDDPRVLTATAEALRELGHQPIPCLLAANAAQVLRDHPDVSLIISDVLMPGMTGPELVATLQAEHPNLPVLFVTGFAGDIEDSAFGGHRVLRKPFTIATLSEEISALLSLASARAA
jgi:signal transduction histidine kinase